MDNPVVNVDLTRYIVYPYVGMQGPQGIPGPTNYQVDLFTSPSNGQTSFSLTYSPISLSSTVSINSSILINGIDYTISGNTLTILSGLGYPITTSDIVAVKYNR